MGKVYTVAMNKGGVGKTSLLTNLASVIAEVLPEKKVLIIDTDGQGNTTLSFGQNPREISENVYDIFAGNATIDDVKISVSENIDLVPANRDMNFVEMDILTDLEKFPKVFELLKRQVDEVIDDYDYIFIDTPPSIGLVTLNALRVADEVIIPFVPEAFSTYGLTELIEAIEDFKDTENPKLNIAGVVGMMIQPVNLHTNLMQGVRQWCIDNDMICYDTTISKSIRFAEAVAEQGSPAIWFDKNHKIVRQYYDLAEEIVRVKKALEV
jgi:chromosome partitioning protein